MLGLSVGIDDFICMKKDCTFSTRSPKKVHFFGRGDQNLWMGCAVGSSEGFLKPSTTQ
jgi:hypothetical protein